MIHLKLWWHIYVLRHNVETWTHPLMPTVSYYCLTCYVDNRKQRFGGSYAK